MAIRETTTTHRCDIGDHDFDGEVFEARTGNWLVPGDMVSVMTACADHAEAAAAHPRALPADDGRPGPATAVQPRRTRRAFRPVALAETRLRCEMGEPEKNNLVDRNGEASRRRAWLQGRVSLTGSSALAPVSMPSPARTVRAVVSTRSVVAVINPTSPRDHRARYGRL